MRAKQGELITPKPNVKDSRVLMYLGFDDHEPYCNTTLENKLVHLWQTKYVVAKKEYEESRVGPAKVQLWRDAYFGKFKELDAEGNPTEVDMKAIAKIGYELVEEKINPIIPAPKMSPRYHSDIVPINATEALIKHEINKMLSEEVHNESERSTLIDSTSWFKVSWNPFDNTHERSGMPIVETCTIDTVYPQPGVSNYRDLEYIFERKVLTVAKVFDLYGRYVKPDDDNDLLKIVECYYLNQDRHVGKFVWEEDSMTVLANDLEWGMRRRRECTQCGTIEPVAAECRFCGSKSLKYVGVKEQLLEQDLSFVTNPYRSGDSAEASDDTTVEDQSKVIPQGTIIPYYMIRQLPFVPKRNSKISHDIYGISEIALHLEPQDLANKFLNKAERKSAHSKTYVTKMKDTRIDDQGKEIAYIEVESAQEAAAMQVKQTMSNIDQEVGMYQILYDRSKTTAGITDTDQGKNDPSARSGKAKELQMVASNSRKRAPQVQNDAAYAGVYELIFKNLLAFCDENRSFVKLLPDGTTREEVWSKYMFLEQDSDGNYYYRDDFAWSVDNASDITQDRASMWQLIDNDFMRGVMGNEIDPARALRMYWHMKDQAGYPTAKFALAFLDEAIQKLPTQIEQALVNNPEAVELALSYIQDMQNGGGLVGTQQGMQQGMPQGGQGGGQHGGARDGAGRANNQQTKSQQQDRANEEARVNKPEQPTTMTPGGDGNDTNTN